VRVRVATAAAAAASARACVCVCASVSARASSTVKRPCRAPVRPRPDAPAVRHTRSSRVRRRPVRVSGLVSFVVVREISIFSETAFSSTAQLIYKNTRVSLSRCIFPRHVTRRRRQITLRGCIIRSVFCFAVGHAWVVFLVGFRSSVHLPLPRTTMPAITWCGIWTLPAPSSGLHGVIQVRPFYQHSSTRFLSRISYAQFKRPEIVYTESTCRARLRPYTKSDIVVPNLYDGLRTRNPIVTNCVCVDTNNCVPPLESPIRRVTITILLDARNRRSYYRTADVFVSKLWWSRAECTGAFRKPTCLLLSKVPSRSIMNTIGSQVQRPFNPISQISRARVRVMCVHFLFDQDTRLSRTTHE